MSLQFKRRKLISWGLRAAGLAAIGKGFANTRAGSIELTHVEIDIPGLPPVFRGTRIVQLTDLHASMIVSVDLFRQAAALVMEAQPDLIVLTGDFISGSTKFLGGAVGEFDQTHLDQCVEALTPLKASMGIFAVLGNHDFWSGPAAIKAITMRYSDSIGVRWLRNQSRRIEKQGSFIDLLGVDDYWESSSSLSGALKGLPGDSIKILLSHNPDINEEIDLLGKRIDLVISGHTHGGQVVVPLLGQPIMPSKFGQKYRVGLVRDGARQTFVSRGVGHLAWPARFNCPPEVALITLR